jgi:hypothetical protein
LLGKSTFISWPLALSDAQKMGKVRADFNTAFFAMRNIRQVIVLVYPGSGNVA